MTNKTNITKYPFAVFTLFSLVFLSFAAQITANCVFCDIIEKKSTSNIIEETDDILVIEKKPIRKPVDCLILPKKHIENCKFLDSKNDYDSTILSKMFFMAQNLSKKLTGKQDFQLVINNGSEAGQTVFHLHMHFKSANNWKK